MLTFLLSSLTPAALASPVELYGFGVRRMGRGGGGIAIADGAEPVMDNPAALASLDRQQFIVGYIFGNSKFPDFPDLYWDTNRDGLINDNDTPLDWGPDYPSHHGALLAGALPMGRTVTLGLGLYLPTEHLIRLETFDPQLPTWFMYSNRLQRYELSVGLGVRPIAGVAFGAGILMIPKANYSLEGTLSAVVSGAGEGDGVSDILSMSLDVHSMTLDIVPGILPIFGVHWDAGQAIPAIDGLTLGAAWQAEGGLPINVDMNLQANIQTEAMEDLDSIVLPMLIGLELGVYDHYVPERLTMGAAWSFKAKDPVFKGDNLLTVSADVRRTAWDRMAVSVAQVVHSEVSGATVDLGEDPVVDGNPYSIVLEPTWATRLGLDVRLPGFMAGKMGKVFLRGRGGFGYEPTPLQAQGSGTALLDADRLIFSGGIGVEHDDPFRQENPGRIRWDAFAQYHMLASDALQRDYSGVPSAGFPVDGADIPLGGRLMAAGMQWSLDY